VFSVHPDVCDLLTVTFLLFLPVLNLLWSLDLRLIILEFSHSALLKVLLLLNLVLNLTVSLLPTTSSHSYSSASDLTCDCWCYINVWLTLPLRWLLWVDVIMPVSVSLRLSTNGFSDFTEIWFVSQKVIECYMAVCRMTRSNVKVTDGGKLSMANFKVYLLHHYTCDQKTSSGLWYGTISEHIETLTRQSFD